jgi:endonuclease YncB( thermonuclease family)
MGLLDFFKKQKDEEESSWSSSVEETTETIKEYLPIAVDQLNIPASWASAIPTLSDDPQQQQQQLLYLACGGGSFLLGVAAGRKSSKWSPRWQRITDLQTVSTSHMGPTSRYLRGRAMTVSDGDTLRFYHVPTWFHSSTPPSDTKLSDYTLAIRVCTIDTPETAKFGKPGQPFGEDAKEALSEMVLSKNIQIQLLTKDQYGRAVAQVRVGGWLPWWYHYADQAMLEAGLAEVYRGSGAVYGQLGKEAYEAMEAKAQTQKVGMWSLGDQRESAAEYKAKQKK